MAALECGRLDEAATLTLQALELQVSEHDARDRAFTLINLGNIELNRNRYAECERYSRQSVELFRELDDALQTATPLFNIGLAALEQGYHAKAELHFWESFALTVNWHTPSSSPTGSTRLPAIHTLRGASERAIPEVAAAAALRTEAGVEAQRFEAALHQRTMKSLRTTTGDERFDQLAAVAHEDPWGVVADTLTAAPR